MRGRINHYEVLEKVGDGGFGSVYRAFDTRLKRFVAVKVLRNDKEIDEADRKRFVQEARILSAIQHPHVTVVHEIDKVDGKLYLVLEFLEGQTLQDRFAEGPLPWEEVLEIAKGLLAALQCVHEAGIIHRDIKPGNIMLPDDGPVKLMDFGISRRVDVPRVTETNQVSGSVGFMSPEQLRGKELDGRSDLFALGIVLYEALTGAHPFLEEENAADCIDRTLNRAPRPLGKIAPAVPPGLQEIVHRALEKKPSARYATAEAMAGACRDLETRLDPRVRKAKLWATLLSGGAIVTLLIVFFLLPQDFELELGMYRLRDGEEQPLVPGDTVTNGDRLHLRLLGSHDYYLYLLLHASEGSWEVMFPGTGDDGAPGNPLPADEPLRLPGSPTLDYEVWGQPGDERIWLVASRVPVPELEELAASLRSVPGGEISGGEDPDWLANSASSREDAPRLRGLDLPDPSSLLEDYLGSTESNWSEVRERGLRVQGRIDGKGGRRETATEPEPTEPSLPRTVLSGIYHGSLKGESRVCLVLDLEHR